MPCDEIVLGTLPTIRLIARHLNGGRRPSEDQEQEGMLAVLKCLPRYDAQNSAGATLATYARPFILNALLRQMANDKAFARTMESADLEKIPALPRDREPQSVSLDCLSGQQRFVVERTFGLGCAEKSTEEIASELGLTTRRVEQILSEALERLRIMLPEPESD